MKKNMNLLALILIIGFVGAWECGSCNFKTMLLNVGITLSVLLAAHFVRIFFYVLKIIKKNKKQNVKHVKIY